jgi:hypothetical protein
MGKGKGRKLLKRDPFQFAQILNLNEDDPFDLLSRTSCVALIAK